jgi:hypothetical protein
MQWGDIKVVLFQKVHYSLSTGVRHEFLLAAVIFDI